MKKYNELSMSRQIDVCAYMMFVATHDEYRTKQGTLVMITGDDKERMKDVAAGLAWDTACRFDLDHRRVIRFMSEVEKGKVKVEAEAVDFVEKLVMRNVVIMAPGGSA